MQAGNSSFSKSCPALYAQHIEVFTNFWGHPNAFDDHNTGNNVAPLWQTNLIPKSQLHG